MPAACQGLRIATCSSPPRPFLVGCGRFVANAIAVWLCRWDCGLPLYRSDTAELLSAAMKRSQAALTIGALALAAVVVAPLAIRGGLRYYALNKVLRLPKAQARLAVNPTRRTLTNQAPVQLINLGYATFDTGSTNQLFIESTSSGAVILTNHHVSIAFLPPFATDRSANSTSSRLTPREARANPNTVAILKEWETDPMAAEMAWEETQLLPLFRILLMSEDDFVLYSLKLSFKAANRIGSNGVEFFQSPCTKGITRVGESAKDSHFAAVHLASPDGMKSVGVRLLLPSRSSTNLFEFLDPILRSFQFTADRVDDREAVKALIRGAGIQQRKETPTDE